MATPNQKDERVIASIDIIANVMNPEGKGFVESIKNDVCALCNSAAVEFTDEKSATEYKISGMCQLCQDDIFGEDV